MKKILAILAATCWLIDLTHAQTTATTGTGRPSSIVGYQIGEPGADSRVWQKITRAADAQGHTIQQTNQAYVELATGMNYLKNGQWVPSKEEIDILPNGTAAATEGRHQAYFPGNIYQGEIRLVTAEGKQLRSRPLGLSYFDGNNSVLIAELKDSTGWLMGSNQVIYPDAFTDFKADLRYTYTKAGFEQDIILREQPPTPESFGLDPETTRLQVLTEFFNPPQPKVLSRREPTRAGNLSDDLLSFGTMQVGRGRAFLLGINSSRVEVNKQWLQLEGRQFLVEEVPVASLANELETLPKATTQAGSKTTSHPVAKTLILPPQRLVKTTPKAMFMTKASVPAQGLVLDYQILNGGLANYTFRGDTTYYISGTVNLSGTNLFEGGAVLKYNNNASLNFSYPAQINCLASAYRPVVFTAKDDNSVGDIISGSTGNPTNYYANPALSFNNVVNLPDTYTLSNLHIAWANLAIGGTSSTVNLYHGQLVNCLNGISLEMGTVYLRNTLFANVQTNFNINYAGVDAQNATFSGSACLAVCSSAGGLTLNNCILANVTFLLTNSTAYVGFAGGHNGFYNAPAFGTSQVTNTFYPFQAVGAGYYYLTNGCNFFNQGVPNIDPTLLADLRQKTTYPPLLLTNQTIAINTTLNPQAHRDTNSSPDLGYHYDPIDYLVDNYAITNATLTVTNGAAIASYNETGVQLRDGSAIVSIGSPLYPNWFVRYSSVQEQSVLLGGNSPASGLTVSALHYGSVGPTGQYRFSKFACPAGGGYLFYDTGTSAYSNLLVQDCELWSGPVDFSGNTSTVTTLQNNLFDRGNFAVIEGAAPTYLSLSNNLIFGMDVAFINTTYQTTWQAYNNAFDSCNIAYSPYYTPLGYLPNGYNAYLNCVNRLTPIGSFDIVTNATLAYQTGPLGTFYQPTNSPLIHAGSTTADQVGLDQYTVTTYEVVEGTNTVSIGYHYVTMNVPVAITQQPVNVTTTSGGNATFSVTVSAISTPPLSYQWYFNSSVLANATNAVLTLTGVTTNQAGNYSVVVANVAGSVTSSNAVLTVNVPPVITQQPQDQTVNQGGTATFSVTVSASSTPPLRYQWYFNSSVLANATNAVLTLTGVTTNQAGNYSVKVGNVAGKVTSSNAVLTVNMPVPPTITQQPTDQTVFAGEAATFTVVADSSLPLTYQWQLNNYPLADGDGISGSQSPVLTLNNVQAVQAGNYTVVVANTAGSVTSAPPATLTVNGPPVITQPPVDQAVNVGQTAVFSVAASGSGLTYQWKHNGDPLSEQSPTLTINNAQPADAGSYSVIVANNAGSANADANMLVLKIQYSGGPMGKFTLSGAPNNSANDIYVRPSLSSGVKYRLFYCGSPGQTVFNCPMPSASFSFFAAGAALDSDGDGLTDGYEALVSHSNPNSQVTLLGGLPDGWNVEWGLDPTTTSGGNGPLGDPDSDGCNNTCEYNGGVNSTDPFIANSSPGRPVVTIAVDPTHQTAIYNGSDAQFIITRTGSIATYLDVNYTVGGTAVYNTDYSLNPNPGSTYPFTIRILAGQSTVTVNVHATASGFGVKTVLVGLVPISIYDQSTPANWAYVVDPYHDRASATVQIGFTINLQQVANGYLQINPTANTAPLPFVNVAESGVGRMARIHTGQNLTSDPSTIIGEFYSAPRGIGNGDPSRTTVDRYGNVWIGNRAVSDANGGSIAEFGVVIGGTRCNSDGTPNQNGYYLKPPFIYNTCIDRDGDGLIYTMLPGGTPLDWPGSADALGGVSAALDETILRYIRIVPTAVRTLIVDPDNNLWVGGRNNNWHQFIDTGTGVPVTGKLLNFTGGSGAYGGVIDGSGAVWSSCYNGNESSPALTRFVPVSTMPVLIGGAIPNTGGNYGITVDPTSGNVWQAVYTSANVMEFAADGQRTTFPIGQGANRGIVVDAHGNVWVGGSGSTIYHLTTSGVLVGSISVGDVGGSSPIGVTLDASGMIWAICQSGIAVRIDPTKNPDSDPNHVPKIGKVVETVNMGGTGPYNYSDMSGFVTLSTAQPSGVWDNVFDAGTAHTLWTKLTMDADIPTGTKIVVEVRAANRATDLPSWPFVTVDSGNATQPGGTSLSGIKGRYLEARANLIRSFGSDTSPTLRNLTVQQGSVGPAMQITAQPQNQVVNPGGTANFSVTVTGPTPSYQWLKDAVPVSGATVSTLSVTGAHGAQYGNAGRYAVSLTSGGISITSAPARLHIMGNPPTVSQQPYISSSSANSVTLTASATVSSASGSDDGYLPVSYQWRFNGVPMTGPGTSGSSSSSSFSVSLTVPSVCSSVGNYSVLFYNQYGEEVTADYFLNNYNPSYPGTQISSMTFNVEPDQSVGNPSDTWSYQWYYSVDYSGIYNQIGGNSSSRTFPAAENSTGHTYDYKVVSTRSGVKLTNEMCFYCSIVNSSFQPSSVGVLWTRGTFDVTFTGQPEAPITGVSWQYQWYFTPPNGSETAIADADPTICYIPNFNCNNWGTYRFEAKDNCGHSAPSAYADMQIPMSYYPNVRVVSTTLNINPNGNPADDVNWNYKWYKWDYNQNKWVQVAAGNGLSSYTIQFGSVLDNGNGDHYEVVATKGSTVTDTFIIWGNTGGSEAEVEVETIPAGTMDVTFTAPPGDPTWTYQWSFANFHVGPSPTPPSPITPNSCTMSGITTTDCTDWWGVYSIEATDRCGNSYPRYNGALLYNDQCPL